MTEGQKFIRGKELAIAQAVAERAIKDGSYQHAKFALEYAGLIGESRKPKDEEEELPGPSLAEILLSKLAELDEQGRAEDAVRQPV